MSDDEELCDEDDESVIESNFGVDKTTGKKFRIPKKVTIEIYDVNPVDGHKCQYSDGAGVDGELSNKPYTHVGFSASYYGSTSPCNTEDDIISSIEYCKSWIIREGDVPIIRDYRIRGQKLADWFGG